MVIIVKEEDELMDMLKEPNETERKRARNTCRNDEDSIDRNGRKENKNKGKTSSIHFIGHLMANGTPPSVM